MAEKPVAHKMIGGGHVVGLDRGERQPTKRHVKSMTMERAKNGGYVVTHHFAGGNGAYHEPEQHVFGPGEHKKVMAHVQKHMGFNRIENAKNLTGGKAEASEGKEPAGGDADADDTGE